MADDSVFDDFGGDSDFEISMPKPKAFTKAAPKATKPTTAKAVSKKAAQTTLKPAAKAKVTSKKRPKPDSEDEASSLGDNGFDDESLLSVTPPKAKKAKSGPAPSKGAKKPLADVVNEAMAAEGSEKPKKGKRVSEQYQMISHLEHIIKRPDTYIGSTERTEKQTWVYNTLQEGMEFREISYVPGLYKIFDEILVNAADNKQNDKNMNEIKVSIDRTEGEISVWNNGRGIPIEIHSKQKIYIPEMIFGNLLSSSNYDDDQQKVTGGRNGYGAKLCNIFSTEFTLETVDSRKKKKYKQTWTQNMSIKGNAKITDFNGDDYTKVTFKPDFAKFGMAGLDDDFEALAKRRVYDLAGTCKGISVRLNAARVPVHSFTQYMKMYTKAIKTERGEEAANDRSDIIHDVPDPRWEIGFAVSDGSFQQVSFVNSIATTSGGTHVNYISDQICNKLAEQIKKKNKGGPALKINQIRNHIFLFVNCQIVNPAFTSQTKEQLTTKTSQMGSSCTIGNEFMKKIQNTDVIANILAFLEKKADQILKKSDGGKRSRISNAKLVDANKAGTKEGYQCTLILTEGDSAKGLAVAGRSMVGPDYFGVFPLRGKLLNVRDASIDQISKNSEIQNIKTFMGLQHKKEYSDTKGLRYGHLMIMTDQDHDGSHIKGLLINFLQVAFPSLLKLPGFLLEFITPIVKAWKGPIGKPTRTIQFYTMPEYEAFKEEHKHEKWEHKYLKGLGTSTPQDAQKYFADLDRHLKKFHIMREHEINLIDLAFSKKRADERKAWLGEFKPGTFLDHGAVNEICYDDFVNKELILFSMADNVRSIPSMIDGLKPGQRKVMFTCFKRNLLKDVKVAQLAGSVSELTHYNHGENSLQQTIVNLAQTYVGSNNVNCLEPSGNFGSRLQGGNDAASARYIYTRLSPFAKKIFHPDDEPLLAHNWNDGHKIEPQTYVPVVPLVLINGTDGIGTGWSSSIPNYDPEEIVANLIRLMDGEAMVPMLPWFRGFKGNVQETGPDRFKFSGKADKTGNNEIEITELPIRVWTQDFKDKLEDIIKAEKIPSFIKDYRDYNTNDDVRFVIQMEEKHMPKGDDEAVKKELEDKFKLSKSIATSNLVAFDVEGRIAKYASVEDIMKDYFRVRIMFYEKRKQWQLADWQRQLEKLSNQARFVQMIIDHKLSISKKKKTVLMAELKKLGFKAISKIEDAKKAGEEAEVAEESDSDENGATGAHDYDYLLGMPLWSLTQERVDKLLSQVGHLETEVDILIKLTKEDLWKRDLNLFLEEWRVQLAEEHQQKRKVNNMGRRNSSKVKVAVSGPVIKKRKGGADCSDDDFMDRPKSKKAAPPKIKKTEVIVEKKTEPLLKNWLSGQGTLGKNPVRSHDGNSSEAEVEPHREPKKDNAVKKAGRAQKPKATANEKPVVAEAEFDDDDDDVVVSKPTARTARAAASKPVTYGGGSETDDFNGDDIIVSKPTVRAARAAASKPITYGGGSETDDSNGDDLLGDITNMVKGLPHGESKTSSESKSLFSTSRTATNGTTSLKPFATTSTKSHVEFSDDDDTNFIGLVPQHSPRRSINVMKNAKLTDDEEEDEEDRPQTMNKSTKVVKAVVKARPPKSATEASNDDGEDLVIANPKKSRPGSKPAPKKGAIAEKAKKSDVSKQSTKSSAPTTAASKKKSIPLSPAAKAYAAKQARNATSKNPKAKDDFDFSDSDDDDDNGRDAANHDKMDVVDEDEEVIDAIADDLLADDDDDDSPPPPPPPVKKAATGASGKSKGGARKNERPAKESRPSPPPPPAAAAGGRPARRAAVEKKKPIYVLSDSDEDDDSEQAFGGGGGGGGDEDSDSEEDDDFGDESD